MAKRMRTSKGALAIPAPTTVMMDLPEDVAIASGSISSASATTAVPETSPTSNSTPHSPLTVATTKTTRGMTTRSRPNGGSQSGVTATSTESVISNPKNRGKGSTPGAQTKHVMLPAFLSKTFEIFSMPEFSSICGWNASGDTIIVSQLEAFVARVLPRFFKHRNFPSFVRQLNLYGFHKTVLDSKRLEFQHPYFKRDRPDLLHYIKRKVSSSSNNQNANSSVHNSRLDAHREISDSLLCEMKELRQRSDAMEKRLRELEVDNAIVRSDNVKLWKQLETAKDKQLIMQEKMKKILWILFQMYRSKKNVPKLSSVNDDPEVLSEDSMLGPKEFREVLRFLAMDEPPLLARSSHAEIEGITDDSRKRKFVEVPSDPTPTFDEHLQALDPPTLNPTDIPTSTDTSSVPTTTLSIFNPGISVPLITSNAESSPAVTSEQVPNDEQVMKKLEDFESSLLDEYDVGCLDSLLQQLSSTNPLPVELDEGPAPDVTEL